MRSLVLFAARLLPPAAARRLDDSRIESFVQFTRFILVGFCGFAADTATVYSVRHEVGLYAAGFVSFAVAVNVTFILNRIWTFSGKRADTMRHQWLRFIGANVIGFVINRGVYVALIASVPFCREQPVVAVFAGGVGGMLANYNLSRRVVFR
jgi:putative flippase GtrA